MLKNRNAGVKTMRPFHRFFASLAKVGVACLVVGFISAADAQTDFSPRPDERQVPFAMHAHMDELPRITVGRSNADLVGADNRVLQAAVDYISALGGGIVEIGEGEFLMRDSLHLRSNVTVRGHGEKTVLRKATCVWSPLVLDGDFGEQQITLQNVKGFDIGYGVAVWDSRSGGFHTTVSRITGRRGNTFAIDNPLMADCMVSNEAQAATVFPVISGYHLRGARIEGLTIDGNKRENAVHLNGCRGAGIFLYRGFGTTIEGCTVRNYNGDGISFQQSNDVTVVECVCEDNEHLGLHPGSGSQRPTIRKCAARRNGTDGLFLCWRVRHGLFEDNVLEQNGRFGISIGHKDSDNLLRRNTVRSNGRNGVFFRNETLGMAAHRNCLEENVIEDNGTEDEAAGIRIRGETNGLVFRKNVIRDTRSDGSATQTVGILIEETVGELKLDENKIEADTPIDDRRPK
jgi:parallel beta-helix repeat protein